MSRIMSRYGPISVPNTGVNTTLFTVPAGKKLEVVTLWLQTNGAAGFNVTLSSISAGGLFAFFWHNPNTPAGPAVLAYEQLDYVCIAGDKLNANCFAGPTAINFTVVAVLVDL